VGVVLLCVNRWELALAIDIAVNAARDVGQLRDPNIQVLRLR